MEKNNQWIGVDFDGTLAEEPEVHGPPGKPIGPMVDRVKKWLKDGQQVKIVTGRYADPVTREQQVKDINTWCEINLGQKLPITNEKDQYMRELWDDRVIPVEHNTGRLLIPDNKLQKGSML